MAYLAKLVYLFKNVIAHDAALTLAIHILFVVLNVGNSNVCIYFPASVVSEITKRTTADFSAIQQLLLLAKLIAS